MRAMARRMPQNRVPDWLIAIIAILVVVTALGLGRVLTTIPWKDVGEGEFSLTWEGVFFKVRGKNPPLAVAPVGPKPASPHPPGPPKK